MHNIIGAMADDTCTDSEFEKFVWHINTDDPDELTVLSIIALEMIYKIEKTEHDYYEKVHTVETCKAIKDLYNEAWEAGRAEGREIGRAEGKAIGVLSTLSDLVVKKFITIEQAAEQAGITAAEFTEKTGLA